jgi:uncharacterized protein (TIGR02466 family)
MPELRPIFPKFVYTENLNISDGYNNEIKFEIIKMLENADKRGDCSITNFGKVNSDQIINNPKFAPLFSMIRENIQQLCRMLNHSTPLKITNVWLSITPPGKYHDVHKHLSSVVAGVYYVSASPSMQINFIFDGNLEAHDNHREQLNSKKLILFDGSLLHGFTHVNESEEPKITIAFNCQYEYAINAQHNRPP